MGNNVNQNNNDTPRKDLQNQQGSKQAGQQDQTGKQDQSGRKDQGQQDKQSPQRTGGNH